MTDNRIARIHDRAYALWEQEGRPEGRHEHHWRQAEQEMGDDSQGATGSGDLAPTGQPMAQPGAQGTGGMGSAVADGAGGSSRTRSGGAAAGSDQAQGGAAASSGAGAGRSGQQQGEAGS